jgi:hypothetical protein
VFVLHDDGYGRVVIEVRRRADAQLVAVSAPALAFSTSAGFQRSARTLRWPDANIVELVPWAGLFGDNHGMLRLDLLSPGSPGTAEPGTPRPDTKNDVTALPPITVQVPDELGSYIEVIGGGPMNGVPAAYETALRTLLEQIRTPVWQAWWAAGTDEVLEIWYDFAAADVGVAIRHTRSRWRATIRRPAGTFAYSADSTGLARHDVRTMLDAIQRRTGLGEHPPL